MKDWRELSFVDAMPGDHEMDWDGWFAGAWKLAKYAERLLQIGMKKAFVAIAALAFVGVLTLLVHRLVANKSVIVARANDEMSNEVLVTEERTGLFEWQVQLCWRKRKGPWMTYLLDGDADFWRDVELTKSANNFEVKHQQQLVGRLNTTDGSIDYPIRKLLVKHPNSVVTSVDPFDRTNRIDSLSVGWTSVWPSTLLNTK